MAQIIPISIQWKRSKKMNARWTSLIRQGREWYEESNALSVSLKEGTRYTVCIFKPNAKSSWRRENLDAYCDEIP